MSGGTGQNGDSFRRVMPGEPLRIEARAYNACLDAAEALGGTTPSLPPSHRDRRSSGLVLVRNDSGGDVDQYEVLGVSGILIAAADNEVEFRQRVMLTGTTPAEGTHEGRFVVALEPIADGGIGMACAAGVVQVQVSVADAGHDYAEVDDGNCANLVSGDSGSAIILARDSGTGLKWAIVRLVAPAAEAGIAQRYGKVVTPGVATPTEGWNEVTLAPCSRAGVDSGEANVTAYCLSGVTVRPNLETGEVVGYVDDGTDCVVNLVKSEAYYGSDP
ncbi:MAG TPA: hypothetical protein PLP01_12890 [Phycisphaerae bacterium]|nr:hypothetical protein [Phycisphaerae bacterium]HOI56141.1 hypothetical protein [Phycisphaerae bacterium]